MKKAIEDNTVSVIQKAISFFRIPVTNGTIKESLKAHPQYPTFKSICDVLNDWNIEHYPLKYEIDEIKDIKTPFIIHFMNGGGQLAFVIKIEDNKVYYFDSYKTKKVNSLDDFSEMCSGAIILICPGEKSGEKEYSKKRQNEILSNAVLPGVIGTVILIIIITVLMAFSNGGLLSNKTQYLLFLTKTIGIVLSVLLVMHEFEVHTSLIDKLCHIHKSTNCNSVLNDTSSKIFGWFGWADVGFVYFMGGFLVLLQNFSSPDLTLLAIMSAISLPYPIFSIYYQGFVLKKWCPLCLGVQVILIAEFLILLSQFSKLHFSLTATLIFSLAFIVVNIVYLLTNMYYREKLANEVHYYKYLGFKKDPDVLKTLLLNQSYYHIPVTSHSLVFGSQSATLIITAFLSLRCSHCARAFNKIKDMLNDKEEIKVNIILISSDFETINALYYLNQECKEKEALELLDHWYNQYPYSKDSISEIYCIPEDFNVIDEIKNENYKLYKECNVNGTPNFFVNGYSLPNQYDITDVKYFPKIIKIPKPV
jgi:uncharacterized membrane protein